MSIGRPMLPAWKAATRVIALVAGLIALSHVRGDPVQMAASRQGFAAAIALLEAARVNETQLAERATGFYWGEPRLKPFVEEMLAEAVRSKDERLEQVARRFLR